MVGIGFGIESEPKQLMVTTTGALGLPTSASVEKGFLPSAVLEETGIIGAILVIVLFGALIRPLLRQMNPEIFAVAISCLLVNVGEMVFFSIGGPGIYFWVQVGLCYCLVQRGNALGQQQTFEGTEMGDAPLVQHRPALNA